MSWQAEDQRRAVDSFWKTKQEKKAEGDDKGGDADGDKGRQGRRPLDPFALMPKQRGGPRAASLFCNQPAV